MITVNATMSNLIRIGHQGENKAVQVAFDLTPFQSAFSGGHPQLVVRRPGDTSGYPVTLIVDGSQAIWIVSSSDTEKYGHVQCELQWFVGDTLAKSDKYNFLIYSSIPGDAEPPDAPSKAWFDKILSDIGDLSDLDTEAKENLVAAINEARLTGGGGSGGGCYRIGAGLKLDVKTNTLSVDTADAVEAGNTKPITSAAVYTEVGNINALLATI